MLGQCTPKSRRPEESYGTARFVIPYDTYALSPDLRIYPSIMKISRTGVASLVTVGVSISLTTLFAQMSGESTRHLVAMGANAKRVVQYEWKQRITVVRKGKPAEPVVDQVRFDSTGQMQRTTISAPPEQKR